MQQLEIWEFLEETLKAEGTAALVVVADSSASSPGRQGFKMSVSVRGDISGTIGGGVLEAKVIKETLRLLNEPTENEKLFTLFHDPNSPSMKSGLICGGSQTIVIKKFTKNDLDFAKQVINTFRKKERKILRIANGKLELINAKSAARKIEFTSENGKFEYREIIGRAETAYIIGGGHVGKAISEVLSSLGFYIVVIEERKKLFTLQQNKFADKIIHAKFDEISDFIEESELSYVIIVTPKHITDKYALASVIKSDVKYIGMMGSERKIDTIFSMLKKEGYDEKLFSKVHAPIGLSINSETPHEIAVSVAAEIVKIKNTRN